MPISATELQERGKLGLDRYFKNKPIDMVTMQRPLLRELSQRKKSFGGAKQYVVEQLRVAYDSNGTWFSGAGTLAYNKRNSIDQAQYPWYQFHDGLGLDEDKLIANGINITEEGKASNMSKAEAIQITNLMDEQMEILRLGAQERFSRDLHLNGAGNADQIVGLDGLLPLVNNTGVSGGIDRATKAFWRHQVVALQTDTLLLQMEQAWRACIKRSVGEPNVIIAGSDFLDAYLLASRTQPKMGVMVTQEVSGKGGFSGDIGSTGLYYKGVPIQYAPEFDDDFGGADTPTVAWSKRCYMLNTNHITLRPIDNNDFVVRKPPRDKEAYTVYWALLWRGTLTCNMPSAHAVLHIA